MKTDVETSIIIRALNEAEHLDKLFFGLNSQNYKNFEIVFVDSGSTDGSDKIAQKNNCKIIRIKKEDFSFGRALNLGCESAQGKYLVFISAHVYPSHKEWLENLINPLKNHEKTGLCYGKQTGDERTKFSEQQIFNKWFPKDFVPDQADAFCNNANCAIKKELWEKYKYDEILTGLEDLDFAKKIKQDGNKICYASNSEIVHVHQETFNQTKNRYMREAVAMKKIEPDFKFSFYYFIQSLLSTILADFAQAVKEKSLTKNFIEIISFRFAQNYGTFCGFNERSNISDALFDKFYGYNLDKEKSNEVSKKLSTIDYEK